MNYILILFSLLLILPINSQEIFMHGEELPFKIIAISSTVKTIHISRGTEDGIMKGVFYKIISGKKVIALALSQQISSASSILSIIKMRDPDFFIAGYQYTIMATHKQYKVTTDPSKSSQYRYILRDVDIVKIDLDKL